MLKKGSKLNSILTGSCPRCQNESMYVSYGLTVAIGVAVFIVSNVFFGLNLVQSFIAIIISLLGLAPITARLARNIYINIFVHYDKDARLK